MVTMDFKENISYREAIEKKVFDSKKLTDSEKRWLFSNPRFNGRYDYPCYQRDIIDISCNRKTRIIINALRLTDEKIVYRPIVSVVGDGEIKVDNALLDLNGNPVSSKKTRMLVCLIDETRTSVSFDVISKSGLISIAYQCEYYDERTKLYTRESSDGAKLTYGMKKQIVSDHKSLYFCKSPIKPVDDFDSFVFSFEFKPEIQK